MVNNESSEMYLETILLLSKEKTIVRPIDVAKKLDYARASVSRAMGILKNEGFIEISLENHITLTESGMHLANKILERHEILSKYFMSLGVSVENASEDACRIEHVISDETFDAIKKVYLKNK